MTYIKINKKEIAKELWEDLGCILGFDQDKENILEIKVVNFKTSGNQ